MTVIPTSHSFEGVERSPWPPVPPTVRLALPLVTVETVRAVLDMDEDQVLALIGQRRLRAFDLRTPGARRSCMRVFAPSISAYQRGRQGQSRLMDEIDWVIGSRLKPVASAAELARRCNVSATHLHNLLSCGCLRIVQSGDGINLSPLVARASVEEFLSSRVLQGLPLRWKSA